MKKPLDVADGKDLRNRYRVVLEKEEGKVPNTELFYPTKQKAMEIAEYLNNLMPIPLQFRQRYIVEKHNPETYVRHR